MRLLLKSAKSLKSWCGRWDSNPHWKDFKSIEIRQISIPISHVRSSYAALIALVFFACG